ncbi:MAG: cell division ATP-binding protein FtsE [Bacilli bacterium]|nr:cell division ATP-binding protein FtsE [Bacilli bacterium]
MELISLKKVNKKYKNGVTAIYDLDLKIKKGEFVFVIGGSGSGKSTLIKMLYREEKPSSGEIMIGGKNVAKLRNSKVYKLRRRLGIVFQDYRLLPKLTVYENVAFALEVIGEKSNVIRINTLKALELVGLKGKTRNYPDQLSGGEQQRVAIARAIVNNPKLLICDEPTGNLDPLMSEEIVNVLDDINKTMGTTVIMATHNKDIVNKFKKRVVALKDGRIVKDYEEGAYDNEII